MLKFIHIIGFLLIYLSASAQKAGFYCSPSANLNSYSFFYILNNPIDVHDLTSPFFSKNDLNENDDKYFSIYNEVSLKNLTIIDGESDHGTLLFNVYQASSFDASVKTSLDYKKKKIKGEHLIIDILNGGDQTLIWRGWIDLKKIKVTDTKLRCRKAIRLILDNFKIEPAIID